MQAVLGRAVERTVGFVCGLFLFGFGLIAALLTADHADHGVRTLVWVLIALGIGVTGAALLPNTISVSGDRLKPLGLNLRATGGAAFFIVALVFLYYSPDSGAAEPSPIAAPAAVAEAPTDTPAPAADAPAPAVPTTGDAAATVMPAAAPAALEPAALAEAQQLREAAAAAALLEEAEALARLTCAIEGGENCAQGDLAL